MEQRRGNKDYPAEEWMPRGNQNSQNLGEINADGFPVNFARHRASQKKTDEIYYQWSPSKGRDFHAVENYGIMKPAAKLKRNLLRNGDFQTISGNPLRAEAWSLWRQDKQSRDKVEPDGKIFITSGRSLHLINHSGKNMNVVQWVDGIKPNTKYKVSFYLKTKNLRPAGTNVSGAGIYVSDTGGKLLGRGYGRHTDDNPWFRESVEFTAPADISGKIAVGLWIWDATGEAWFDHVRLEEIK